MKLKRISLILSALFACFATQAQIKYIPPTAHSFSFGIGGGITKLYGDFLGKPIESAIWGDLNYNVTPYFCIGIEGQQGTLMSGGLDASQKQNGFYVNNTYTSIAANARLSVGAFLTHVPPTKFNLLVNGIYAGAGFGLLHNDIHTNEFNAPNGQGNLLHGGINNDSKVANVPLSVGIDINMPTILGYSGLAVNFNYQYNICLSDVVDGYDPNIKSNKSNDYYTLVSAGLRFNFGRIR